MTAKGLLIEIISRLRAGGISDPESDGLAIVCDALGISPAQARLDTPVSGEKADTALSWCGERIKGRPVQYITGRAPFMDFMFYVEEGVLIPRGDTERLCERALEVMKDAEAPRVADLCSGSGCIGLSIAKYRPDSFVTLVEISGTGALVSEKNRRLLETENVNIINADVFETDLPDGTFDLIVSNPPYIPDGDIEKLDSTVKDHEPAVALKGGRDGLDFYRGMAPLAMRCLRKGGSVLFEVGIGQSGEVSSILRCAGFSDIRVTVDYGSVERVVEGRK